MKKIKKLSFSQISQKQLFFHDLMNQIHGLSLFLEHKASKEEVIDPRETHQVLAELEIIQQQVQDYFQLEHRNFLARSEYRTFYEIKTELVNVIRHYLPNLEKANIEFSGQGKNEGSAYLVHSSYFFRIITNIAKNIAENGAGEATFLFDYQPEGLTIRVQNRRNVFTEEQKANVGGVGLKSMEYLAEGLGGRFSAQAQGPYWITTCFLPNPEEDVSVIPFKKAA